MPINNSTMAGTKWDLNDNQLIQLVRIKRYLDGLEFAIDLTFLKWYSQKTNIKCKR